MRTNPRATARDRRRLASLYQPARAWVRVLPPFLVWLGLVCSLPRYPSLYQSLPAAWALRLSSPLRDDESDWRAAQTLGLACDAMVLLLMEAMGQQSDEMFARHANME